MCLKHLKKIPYPVDLATLSRVELHTTEDFGAPAFHVLGNGSFLHFIATQPKAVEALGGQCIGSSMESQHIVRTKEKLICFISQLKGKTKDDKVCFQIVFTSIYSRIYDLTCHKANKVSNLAFHCSSPLWAMTTNLRTLAFM